jgi:hypothetical protein
MELWYVSAQCKIQCTCTRYLGLTAVTFLLTVHGLHMAHAAQQQIHEKPRHSVLILTCQIDQVGDYASEMDTWDRPENMTTTRTNITISTANGTSATGADLVGNAAAALAAASIVWETTNSAYAAEALIAAKDLYTFAQTVRLLNHLCNIGACNR